jgi:hypothetical protein
MTFLKPTALVAAAMLALPTAAFAAPVIYFGQNPSPAPPFTVSGAPVTARNSFLSQLSGVSQESFETYALGASPPTLSFSGSAGNIIATLSGTGIIENNAGGAGSGGNAFGRFATQGSQYYETTSSFGATFSTAVAAFGFYGTDIGDFNGLLTITLKHAVGPDNVITVNTNNPSPDGSLLFWGVIDQANPFTSVQFGVTAGSGDFFGFDQMVVGDLRQVTGGVPESSTWAMMIAGFGIVGFAMRARARKVTFSALA